LLNGLKAVRSQLSGDQLAQTEYYYSDYYDADGNYYYWTEEGSGYTSADGQTYWYSDEDATYYYYYSPTYAYGASEWY
jgi:hypothetical protein